MKLRKLFISLLFFALSAGLAAGLVQLVSVEKRMCLKKRGELLAGGFRGAIFNDCEKKGSGSGGSDEDGGSKGGGGSTGDSKGK